MYLPLMHADYLRPCKALMDTAGAGLGPSPCSAKEAFAGPHFTRIDDRQDYGEPRISGADLYDGETLVRRGCPKLSSPRQLLSLRLPAQVIARWKATGPGWQTRMAEALQKSAPKSC